jgi:hypothetical protein
VTEPTVRAARPRVEGLLGVVAAVLLPLGLLVILLGWYGAAHSPYLWEQVPYLISGGLVGLALVVGAGLLYFGSWLTRSAAAQQRATEDMASVLREIRAELAQRPADPAPVNGSRRSRPASAFVATARGSMWHRPDCAVVAGREDLRPVEADGGGLRPCALCDPLAAVPSPS